MGQGVSTNKLRNVQNVIKLFKTKQKYVFIGNNSLIS